MTDLDKQVAEHILKKRELILHRLRQGKHYKYWEISKILETYGEVCER